MIFQTFHFLIVTLLPLTLAVSNKIQHLSGGLTVDDFLKLTAAEDEKLLKADGDTPIPDYHPNDFFNNRKQKCEAKRNLGELCASADDHCNPNNTRKLRCHEGFCTAERFISSGQKFFNEPCWSNRDCVNDNSFCYFGNPCNYKNGKCGCFAGFSDDYGRLCLRHYNWSCNYYEEDELQRCNKARGFACVDNRCQCESSKHQEFSEELRRCITLVGSPCSSKTRSNDLCTQNAECIDIEGQGRSECRCKDGFLPVNGKCYLGHGQQCGSKKLGGETVYDPVVEASALCDSVAPLHCREGTCQCEPDEFFDKEKFSCRGLVGAACAVDNEGYDCADGGICKPIRKYGAAEIRKSGRGRCECEEGFQMNGTKMCVKVNYLKSEIQSLLYHVEKNSLYPGAIRLVKNKLNIF